jgi:DNA-binding LacI/PurR family transcriptional regulator
MARKPRGGDRGGPTLRDIAAKAGVTAQAVSLALNNREGVSAKRRKQINGIARRMGYYPREAARILASKTTDQVGIVISREPDAVSLSGPFEMMLSRFVDVCEESGRRYHVEFHHHAEDTGTRGGVPPRAVAGGLLDGVVILGDVGDPLRDWMTARKIPFVSVEEPAAYSVVPDEGAGMEAALEHVHALGHRRVAAVFGPRRYAVQRLRWKAFQEGVKRFGLELPDPAFRLRQDKVPPAQWSSQVAEWARALLAHPQRPTAIIGGGHAVCYTVLNAGLRFPRDISLIDWAHPDAARRQFIPPMAAIHSDHEAIMREALGMLDTLLEGGRPDPANRTITALFYPADSTGPAPSRPRKARQ